MALNLFAAASEVGGAASTTQSAAKRQAVASRDVTKLTEVNDVAVKLNLSNALQVRALRGVVFQCYQVPTDHAVLTALKSGSVSYQALLQKLRDAGKSQKEIKKSIGIPSIHMFQALVNLVVKELETTQPQIVPTIQAQMLAWGGWEKIHKHVPHCRIAKMFEGSVKKWEISLPMLPMLSMMDASEYQGKYHTPTHFWVNEVDPYLERQSEHIEPLIGTAPSGDLEKKLQAYLDGNK